MRQLGIAAISAGLVVMFAAPPASGARSHKAAADCPAGRSHLIVADAQAQVYEAPAIASLPEYLDFIGCAYGQRKSYDLGIPPTYGSPSGSGGTGQYTLAGPIVAFEEFSNGGDEIQGPTQLQNKVVVRNLHTGRVLHIVPTGTPGAPPANPGDIGIGGTTAIVVKSDGAVAWIVQVIENAVPKDRITYQVHAVDKTGSRVLASGPEIEPSSLALAGSTLYWMQAGKAMSASLD